MQQLAAKDIRARQLDPIGRPVAPTYGRVSRSGVMPMSFSLDVVGPLARRARDCARLLSIIAGVDSADATSLGASVPDYETAIDALTPLPHIGIARGYFDEEVHPAIASMLSQAVDVLRRIGFAIQDVAMPTETLREIAELDLKNIRPKLEIACRPDFYSGHCLHPGAEAAGRVFALVHRSSISLRRPRNDSGPCRPDTHDLGDLEHAGRGLS